MTRSIVFVVLAIHVLALPGRAAADTFTVVNTDPSGVGSFSQAITDANGHDGLDTIVFAIPGAGVHTIVQTSDLPAVSDPVTIDAVSQQTGAAANTNPTGQGLNAAPKIVIQNGSPNAIPAVLRLSGGGSTVRGLVINNSFGRNGIQISGPGGNLVAGCFLGTDATGTSASGNSIGIQINGSPNNVIGGLAPADRNLISGNFGAGIAIIAGTATGNQVLGNLIGTTISGTAALGNTQNGIEIGPSSSQNTIGGMTTTARNVISGNGGGQYNGVVFTFGTTGNVVLGNFIGTDVTGTAAVGNSHYGVAFSSASGNTVGGAAVGAGNVVSGNGLGGLLLTSGSNANHIEGNLIGLTAAATAVLADAGRGIDIQAGTANVIGGTAAGAGNVIAGNTGDGVHLEHSTTSGTLVQGNTIGTNLAGAAGLGNGGAGVDVNSSSGNTIGGTVAGAANRIVANLRGVSIRNSEGVAAGNAILGNAIDGNTALGIDLGADGVTPNDLQPGDGDGGPNTLQNVPVLTCASVSGGGTRVEGSLESTASTQFRVEFFASPIADPSGSGEGATFLGARTVTTNGNGTAGFSFTVPVVGNGAVTATATNPGNDTSEFSVATTQACAPASEDCANCLDDDGDTLVDRDDPDCAPRAAGAGQGVGDAVRAKALTKCAKALAKAGATFASKKLAVLDKCVGKVFLCRQLKPGDAACVTGAKCAGAATTIAAIETKLEQSVGKACGGAPPLVPLGDLLDATGLGYGSEQPSCVEAGVATLTSAADVARCVGRRSECAVERLLARTSPRSLELATAGGLSAGAFPCLDPVADGGGLGLGDPKGRGKVAGKCEGAIEKSVAAFAKGRLQRLQKCSAAVLACVQLKPSDGACVVKARGTCTKLLAALAPGASSLAAKAMAKITKACGGSFDVADLLAASGVGHGDDTGFCAALGVAGFASAADVAECVLRHAACRVDQLFDAAAPRGGELLGIGK